MKKVKKITLLGEIIAGLLVAMFVAERILFHIDPLPPAIPDRFGDSGVA